MDHQWPAAEHALPRFPRSWDGRATGQRASGPGRRRLNRPTGLANWSLRRLIWSTVSVNAAFWAALAVILWWILRH
jgi:hypothetical protein